MSVYLCYKQNCPNLAEEQGAIENTTIFDSLEKATDWFVEQVDTLCTYGWIVDEHTLYRCLFGSDKARVKDNLLQMFGDEFDSDNLVLNSMYYQDNENKKCDLIIEKHEIK